MCNKKEEKITKYEKEIENIVKGYKENSRFKEMDNVIQHGETTVLEHSVNVAYLSLKIAFNLKLSVDYNSIIKGALLHDYFLYNRKDKTHKGIHGFTHPKTALKNAKNDFSLNKIEENIIIRHMFPLTIIPPKYIESLIVCLADTLSATVEFVTCYKKLLFNKFVKE